MKAGRIGWRASPLKITDTDETSEKFMSQVNLISYHCMQVPTCSSLHQLANLMHKLGMKSTRTDFRRLKVEFHAEFGCISTCVVDHVLLEALNSGVSYNSPLEGKYTN